jgi:hypothetical protein
MSIATNVDQSSHDARKGRGKHAPAPVPVPARPRSSRQASTRPRQGRGEGVGLFAKLVSIGFWVSLASLIVRAVATGGGLVHLMLPLLGLGYLVFCLIAWTGDRNVE